jgi:hypothetical protein
MGPAVTDAQLKVDLKIHRARPSGRFWVWRKATARCAAFNSFCTPIARAVPAVAAAITSTITHSQWARAISIRASTAHIGLPFGWSDRATHDFRLPKRPNRALDSAEIIAELVNLAKDMWEAKARGEKLGLSEAELAFYDAVCQNDSAVLGMGDDLLKQIAHELVFTVQQSATIDWNLKASVQAGLRARVCRLAA